jgi:hypothetical protein
MNCDSNAYSQIPHKLLQDCDRKPQKKQNKTKQNVAKLPFYAKLEVTIV